MCGQLNGDCQESRPSPLNKVRRHRRDHGVDLHTLARQRPVLVAVVNELTSRRSFEIANALGIGRPNVYRALEN